MMPDTSSKEPSMPEGRIADTHSTSDRAPSDMTTRAVSNRMTAITWAARNRPTSDSATKPRPVPHIHRPSKPE